MYRTEVKANNVGGKFCVFHLLTLFFEHTVVEIPKNEKTNESINPHAFVTIINSVA